MSIKQFTMFARTLCIVVYIFSSVVGARAGVREHGIYEKDIRDLSNAIKAASSYREDFRRLIDSIEDSLASASTEEERCALSLRLARKFRPVNTDSSLFYAHKAIAISESLGTDYRQRSKIATIDALATAGLFTGALEIFSDLGKENLEKGILLDYWLAGRRIYGYMKSYAQGNQECYNRYDVKCRQYDDSLLLHLPRNSHLRGYLECEMLVSDGRYHEAQEGLDHLLEVLSPAENLYGMSAYQMALVWKNIGQEDRYASMLAVSALSDVKGCVTEGLALPTLADWLYRQGELGEAFSFINFALEEASAGNVRMRAVTIAQFVPIIDDAYNAKINSSRDELMIYFLLVTILLIATVLLIVFLVRQNKKTRATAAKLADTAKRQESYIGNFIGLYSSYADRLTRLTKLVSTKLAAGQGAELKKLIDSGRFTDQDNDDVHKMFDTAFLDIYPDFVNRINTLLKPEEAIVIKTPATLTPELRIYAFVKLGIDESTRIAQILHYSANTVYAYRNKMRNKAMSRETFDTDVKEI